jgi:ABC-type phosphate transport system permease subunit
VRRVQAPRRKRTIVAGLIAATTVIALVLAPAALAADGVGLGGRTTDKSVTFFCFGVIALFMILPIVLSLIQAKLDGRKERMREQIERVRRS